MIRIGIDVGSTNTDAVLAVGREVKSSHKETTTKPVSIGVIKGIETVLKKAKKTPKEIEAIMIGTTQFVNAFIEKKHLKKVAVLRISGPSTQSIKGCSSWPQDLANKVCGFFDFLPGGFEYNGELISKFDEEEIKKACEKIKHLKITQVTLTGVFSPLNPEHELKAKQIIKKEIPSCQVTMSHKLGNIGILERENSAVINSSLQPYASQNISQIEQILRDFGFICPLYFTQNDGTLMTVKKAKKYPVLTFSSGPTNSMRGAAFLSNIKNAIVCDIGGLSADIGVLVSGFPRETGLISNSIAGISTSFRLPDVLSIGLGGGSKIRYEEKNGKIENVTIGPDSLGHLLEKKGIAFGGDVLCLSDIAISKKIANFGNFEKVSSLNPELIEKCYSKMFEMLETAIDQMKTSNEPLPILLVGGGAALIPEDAVILGSKLTRPKYFDVCNAIGAVNAQIGHSIDQTCTFSNEEDSRNKVLKKLEEEAREKVILNGAIKETVKVADIEDIPLAYLPGKSSRIKLKVVGDLLIDRKESKGNQNVNENVNEKEKENEQIEVEKSFESITIQKLENIFKEEQEMEKEQEMENEMEKEIPKEEVKDRILVDKNGYWILEEKDIHFIATGAAILGSGGGGSPKINSIRAIEVIRSGKQIKIKSPKDIGDDEKYLMVAGLGSPAVAVEKIFSGEETQTSIEAMKNVYNLDHLDGLIPAEIGGLNSLEPMIVGARMGLPTLSCDSMSRAFPQLNQVSFFIYGQDPFPCAISDERKNSVIVHHAQDSKSLEGMMRSLVAFNFGAIAGVALPVITGEMIKKYGFLNTIDQAWRIGKVIHQAKLQKVDPVKAIFNSGQNGKVIFVGKIFEIERRTTTGFAIGSVRVQGFDSFANSECKVDFQNENLIAKIDGKTVVTTPDIIVFVETLTAHPITTEDLRYGQRVSVLAFPAPPLLTNEKALAHVGPKAFGFKDEEYKPFADYSAPSSVFDTEKIEKI
ncbi:hydantoinase [Anaeramoeba ignava]|uniref:Hydantoinase n=1 Tax=Anaeramoeba ignava TaxID=1746090 RepID=A0A9Q0LV37_ANAIG|nr:hydantoinase [Anaeramoeba ignava]